MYIIPGGIVIIIICGRSWSIQFSCKVKLDLSRPPGDKCSKRPKMNSFLPSYEFLLLDHSNVSTYRESYCGDDPECFQQQQQQQQYSYQHDQDREEDIQLIDHFLVQENLSLPDEEEQRSNDNQGAELTVPPVRQRFQANARERCRTQRCGSQRFLLFLSCRGCVDYETNLEIFLCSSW